MSILEKLNQEIKLSMKNKESFRLNSLRYMKALLQNNSLCKTPLSEENIILSHLKKMQNNLELYEGASLEDLKKEITIIQEFLPKSMSLEEISLLIDKHISLGNFGSIMKAVKEEVTGSFDGKLVSEMIKSKIS